MAPARLTVATLGPALLPLLPWIGEFPQVDVFAIAELPAAVVEGPLAASVRSTGHLWVIEEHAARGGLGEFLCAALARTGIGCHLHHSHAAGYPTGRYGSQAFHQGQSALDTASLRRYLDALLPAL